MLSFLDLVVIVVPVHIGNVRVVIVETSRSGLVHWLNSSLLESLDHHLFCFPIAQSKLETSCACTLVSKVVYISRSVHNVLHSSDHLKIFWVCAVWQIAQAQLNNFSGQIFTTVMLIVKPISIESSSLLLKLSR